jgi:hypothetical protein
MAYIRDYFRLRKASNKVGQYWLNMAHLIGCFPIGKELESKPLAVCEHPLKELFKIRVSNYESCRIRKKT